MEGGHRKELIVSALDHAFETAVQVLYDNYVSGEIADMAGVDLEPNSTPIERFRRGLEMYEDAYDTLLKETDSPNRKEP